MDYHFARDHLVMHINTIKILHKAFRIHRVLTSGLIVLFLPLSCSVLQAINFMIAKMGQESIDTLVEELDHIRVDLANI